MPEGLPFSYRARGNRYLLVVNPDPRQLPGMQQGYTNNTISTDALTVYLSKVSKVVLSLAKEILSDEPGA